jgi:hypothetical protein
MSLCENIKSNANIEAFTLNALLLLDFSSSRDFHVDIIGHIGCGTEFQENSFIVIAH